MVENGQYPINKEKCSICGYNKHLGSLQIHHIDGDHQNNNIENLQVLCSNCHMKYHHENPKKGKRNKNRDKKEDITQELQNAIENISYELDRYQKAHFVDMRKIQYYQEWLYKNLDNKTYRDIQKKVNEIE